MGASRLRCAGAAADLFASNKTSPQTLMRETLNKTHVIYGLLTRFRVRPRLLGTKHSAAYVKVQKVGAQKSGKLKKLSFCNSAETKDNSQPSPAYPQAKLFKIKSLSTRNLRFLSDFCCTTRTVIASSNHRHRVLRNKGLDAKAPDVTGIQRWVTGAALDVTSDWTQNRTRGCESTVV